MSQNGDRNWVAELGVPRMQFFTSPPPGWLFYSRTEPHIGQASQSDPIPMMQVVPYIWFMFMVKMQLNIPYHGCCVDMILIFVGSLFDSQKKTRHTLLLLEPFVCIQFPRGNSAHNYRQESKLRIQVNLIPIPSMKMVYLPTWRPYVHQPSVYTWMVWDTIWTARTYTSTNFLECQWEERLDPICQ